MWLLQGVWSCESVSCHCIVLTWRPHGGEVCVACCWYCFPQCWQNCVSPGQWRNWIKVCMLFVNVSIFVDCVFPSADDSVSAKTVLLLRGLVDASDCISYYCVVFMHVLTLWTVIRYTEWCWRLQALLKCQSTSATLQGARVLKAAILLT